MVRVGPLPNVIDVIIGVKISDWDRCTLMAVLNV